MERFSSGESIENKSEKQKSFEEVSHLIEAWGLEFEQRYREGSEVPSETADVLYEFSNFIREKSELLLSEVRAQGEYRKEQATAKLHEYNLAQIELLNRSAEIIAFYPDAIDILARTYPWIMRIQEWAENIKK